jgi:hypothetical protein
VTAVVCWALVGAMILAALTAGWFEARDLDRANERLQQFIDAHTPPPPSGVPLRYDHRDRDDAA